METVDERVLKISIQCQESSRREKRNHPVASIVLIYYEILRTNIRKTLINKDEVLIFLPWVQER